MAAARGRLDGKVALISGAARGMGASMAHMFAREGARVLAFDIDEGGVAAVAAEITSAGGQALAMALDVSQEAGWNDAAARAVKCFGGIDILVNNAGICPDTAVDDIDLEEWDRVQAVNLRGAFLGIKAVLPQMKACKKGAIVNIASIGAKVGFIMPHYSASKAGLASLTRVTAVYQGKHGIRCNAILPGVIATEMLQFESEEAESRLKEAIPLRSVGQAEDVATAALFLASDEARFISGAELTVDGAFSLTNSFWV
jgi:cyclopentanol dehydrogenase